MQRVARVSSRKFLPFKNIACYSTASETFLAKDITVTKTTTPKQLPKLDTLVFGKTFSDHMLEAHWTAANGWQKPTIVPLHNISLAPSCSVFHYAIECFEGMKAYKDAKGNIRLFRPDLNAARFLKSSVRISLPSFSVNEFIESLKEFVRVEKNWVPSEKGYSLYLRPTMISTEESLGVSPPTAAMMFVIASPVGPYYPTGFAPVSLIADPNYVRAFPGGTGDYKVGSNYAPTIYPFKAALKQGYSQMLWLLGEDHKISECGTMNMFFLLKNKQGETELVTAPLDGTILPGVTRQSILDLTRQWGEFKVSERYVTMAELIEALAENRVYEAFGAGTAAVVSPVKLIHFQGKDYHIPLDKSDPNALAGKLTKRIWDTISAIQYGEVDSPWSVVV